MSRVSVLSLEASKYQRHPLHQGDRTWVETNCYADLWIEVLHALGLDPLACLGFTFAVDFEGDQWTFFKPSLSDLHALYGVDAQELNLWRPLVEHAVLQVERGRLVLAEVDAFYLPDTQGTDYRQGHTKTTIAIESVDLKERKLGYFHNAGYFELGPEDFGPLFQLDVSPGPGFLPPYVEFAKVSELKKRPVGELTQLALGLLTQNLSRAPKKNPVAAFAEQFGPHMGKLQSKQWPDYHLYAFATLRQLGAAFELGGHHLRWLESQGETGLLSVASTCDVISTNAKSMILKVARAVTTGKQTDFAPLLETMRSGWDTVMETLRARYAP